MAGLTGTYKMSPGWKGSGIDTLAFGLGGNGRNRRWFTEDLAKALILEKEEKSIVVAVVDCHGQHQRPAPIVPPNSLRTKGGMRRVCNMPLL